MERIRYVIRKAVANQRRLQAQSRHAKSAVWAQSWTSRGRQAASDRYGRSTDFTNPRRSGGGLQTTRTAWSWTLMDVELIDGRLRFGQRLIVSFHRTLRLPEDSAPIRCRRVSGCCGLNSPTAMLALPISWFRSIGARPCGSVFCRRLEAECGEGQRGWHQRCFRAIGRADALMTTELYGLSRSTLDRWLQHWRRRHPPVRRHATGRRLWARSRHPRGRKRRP